MSGYGFHYGPCGGAVLSAGGVAVLIGGVWAFAERHTIGQAVGQAIGEAVTVAVVVLAVAAVTVPVAAVAWVRHSRRKGAEVAAAFAARREEVAAIERAEKQDRRRHALEVAAAGAPRIQNTVVLDRDALEAMVRGYAPATVITDTKEIR